LKSYYIRTRADEKLHQRVIVCNMSTIYYIFKACDSFPSSHKIEFFPKLRYVLGARYVLIIRQARTILSFRSSTVMSRVT